MTKRMIDADALLEWLQDSDNIELLESVPVASVDFLITKINELATSAPEPQTQESIFDITKWRGYLKSNGHEDVLYKILFNNQKTLKIMPSAYSGGDYLAAFDDDNFNPLKNTFHRDIFKCLDLDVNDFLSQKKESIFDADGWCWDLSKAPMEQNIILLVNNKAMFGLKSSTVEDEYSIHQYYPQQFFIYTRSGLMATLSFSENEDCTYKLNLQAWKPLPNTPKEV